MKPGEVTFNPSLHRPGTNGAESRCTVGPQCEKVPEVTRTWPAGWIGAYCEDHRQ